jgi:hypothetical protein
LAEKQGGIVDMLWNSAACGEFLKCLSRCLWEVIINWCFLISMYWCDCDHRVSLSFGCSVCFSSDFLSEMIVSPGLSRRTEILTSESSFGS